jgi:phage terminase small subunit
VKTKSTPRRKGTTQKGISGRTIEAIEAALPRDIGDNLNVRQREFVKQYLVDLNATRAAIRAGYSVHTAKEIGYQNLQKPHIARAIDAALAKFGGITRTRLLKELGLVAFADIGKVVTWNDAAHEIGPSESETVYGEGASASVERLTKVMRSKVTILPSTAMDPAVRRAISKVVTTENGGLRIEMHDKIAALDKLARALGMYTERRDLDPKSVPFAAVTIYEGRPATWLAPGEVADNPRGGRGEDGD